VLKNMKAEDQVERMVGKVDVADIDALVDVSLEQIAGLVALDPLPADICGQARLGCEVENVLPSKTGSWSRQMASAR
jgi:hypothetical protein